MPGKNPAKAYEAFIDPLQSALSCVAYGKLTTTPGGRGQANTPHTWSLNRDAGAVMGDSGHRLRARMNYRIIKDDRPDMGPWRVTTEGYMYSVEAVSDGTERFSFHWHPETVGEHVFPHVHMAEGLFNEEGAFLARTPIPGGRMTFETIVRYVIKALGVPALCDDWDAKLTLAEAPHKLYRTWHNDPGESAKPTG